MRICLGSKCHYKLCIGLASINEHYISSATSSCKDTTTGCGLNKLDIETQGSTNLETLRPCVKALFYSGKTAQGLQVTKFY